MSKIIRLTESELIQIVKRVINEANDLSLFREVKTKPSNMTAYILKKPVTFQEAQNIMDSLGDKYKLASNLMNHKDTLNDGEYWTNKKHGNYNIEYFSFKDKAFYNGNSLHKKRLMIFKK